MLFQKGKHNTSNSRNAQYMFFRCPADNRHIGIMTEKNIRQAEIVVHGNLQRDHS